MYPSPENNTKTVVTDLFYKPGSRLADYTTLQDGRPSEWNRVDFESCDTYGNLTSKKVTAADAPDLRRTTYMYSPDGYFLALETNALGHPTSQTVDPASGEISYLTRPNAIWTENTIDAWGRIVDTQTIGEQPSYTRYRWCVPNGDCPNHAVYKVIAQQSGAPITTDYVDRLGRTVKRT